MRKFLFIIFVLLLAACAEVPSGNYYLIPSTGTLEGTYQHVCYGEECWNIQVVTPTEVFPTPTPEVTIVPTVTSTAVPKTCQLKAVTSIRVRSGPSTQNTIIGLWGIGEQKTFFEFYSDENSYLWGHHVGGWSALYYWPTFEWLVAGTVEADVCRDISTWPWNLVPPEPVVWGGFHTLAGEGVGVLLSPQYIYRYQLLKCLDNGFSLCEQAKAINPNIKIIYRTFQHDCVTSTDPETWWKIISPHLPAGADWYEVMNECDWKVEKSEEWADFMISMALIVERERGAALLAFSSGPGNPDFPWWRGMWKYVDFTKTRLAPNGLQHGIATHSSMDAPPEISLPSDSWVNNPYIANREKIVCELADANHYGTSCSGVLWINTEIGWGDGYQGNKDVFSCYQKGLIYRETLRRKREDGVVDGFTLWNVGKIGQWSSEHDCLSEILKG